MIFEPQIEFSGNLGSNNSQFLLDLLVQEFSVLDIGKPPHTHRRDNGGEQGEHNDPRFNAIQARNLEESFLVLFLGSQKISPSQGYSLFQSNGNLAS